MSKGNSQRAWHAGKPKKKPDYNPDAVTEELVQTVVDCYMTTDENNQHPSLSQIVEELPDYHLNPMKVRRILITANSHTQSHTQEPVGRQGFVERQSKLCTRER